MTKALVIVIQATNRRTFLVALSATANQKSNDKSESFICGGHFLLVSLPTEKIGNDTN